MTIIVKDFQWRQSKSTVTIKVPLHGVHQSKVELFTSPEYVKAIFEKNFFEAFLLFPINKSSSKCTITEKEIIFELAKIETVQWESLEIIFASKTERQQLKNKIIEEEHQRFQKECQEKSDHKSELKRVAVREQINLDTKQRELIESIKTAEKRQALGDVESWRERHSTAKINEITSDEDEIDVVKKIQKRRAKVESFVPMPLPRKASIVEVDFTPRALPTPSRESKLEEENEWLAQQAQARRTVGFMSEDLRPEERNPQYLLSKGEDFLKAKNYLAAISAFSFGIKLSEKFVDLYIGRSEAQLAQGNLHRTIQDCSTALDLMKPAVSVNLDKRATCIARRGIALCKIGMKKEGLQELEIASKMKPSDKSIKENLENAKIEIVEYEAQ